MLKLDIKKQLHGASGQMDLAVKLWVKKGEFVALMGESGAGKTTLLRVIAGLESIDGEIVVAGQLWKGVAPQQREIGFVFQDYALFENMTVEENLLFVNPDKKLASELLEMTELEGLSSRNVTGLSGGQKQRVSLCRALMNKPKLLLMDEPFSALDSSMRSKLQEAIKKLHQRFGTTTLMVSHDISEVFALADRICVLKEGSIYQDGTMKELFFHDNPKEKVMVLEIEEKRDKVLATVSVAGKLLEIEVDTDTKVGQMIEITLKGARI